MMRETIDHNKGLLRFSRLASEGTNQIKQQFFYLLSQKKVFLSTQILWLSRWQDLKMITACKYLRS